MFEKISFLSFSNLLKNRSIQNFLFLSIIQSSNILISIISMPLLITSIGLDQFGLVNLALSVIILLNIVVGFGYNLSAPKEVAVNQKNKEVLSHLVSNVFSAKALLAALCSLGVIIAVYGLNLFTEYQTILVFSVLLLFSEATLPLWFFQGMEKMKLISIANVFSKLLFLLGIVLFIHSPEQSKWVNFMLGAFGISINLFLLSYIHQYMEIRVFRPEFSNIFKSLKSNVLFFFSNLASHISINGGLIILSFFSVPETLGMYSLAERVVMVLRLFPALIIQAVFPNSAKLFQEDQPAFFRFLKKVYIRVLITGAFIAAGTHFMADWIIEILAKDAVEDSIIYLKILAAVPFMACLNVGNVLLLLVADLRQLLFKASWLMCLYMIVTASVLTSILGGIGLCIAIISTELAVFIICLVILYRRNPSLIRGLYF